MGIVNPRPAMRCREERRVRNVLAKHHKLMTALEAEGMTREEASKKAYGIITRKKAEAIETARATGGGQ